MVRLWVANTDPDWFDYLASQPDLDEVNFWQPSGNLKFGAIRPGELFFFRLKSPRNAIGGFGVFSHASTLPVSLAWESFGTKNGASSFEEMCARIKKLRTRSKPTAGDYNIGARIVAQPVFLPRQLWIPQPDPWPSSIVVGKRYDAETGEGRRIWEQANDRGRVAKSSLSEFEDPARRFGPPALIAPRLGQGAFRIAVTDAYGRACAITGNRVLPALDAAHIRPFALGGTHTVSNGMLLRRDIHRIFDFGICRV